MSLTIPGEVYKAEDTRLDRMVAIKVLPEHLAGSPERKRRFEREAKAISQLNHPHICTLYDVGEQDGVDYIAFEYIEGETLSAVIARGAPPLDQLLAIALPLAEGLDYAHKRGVVHRDLKPANVMVSNLGIPKILDFGLAKRLSADALSQVTTAPMASVTEAGAIVGTLPYMAPEQLRGEPADARSDIFSFGALLYELVTGQRTFSDAVLSSEPVPLRQVRPDVQPELVHVVEKTLRKDPNERYQDVADLAADVRHLKRQSGGQGTLPAPVMGPAVPNPSPHARSGSRSGGGGRDSALGVSRGSLAGLRSDNAGVRLGRCDVFRKPCRPQ